MDVLVLCGHLPGEGHFESERFEVRPLLCVGDFDYHRGVNEHWDGPATLIIFEHDMEASDAHIAALIDCPEPLCTWACQLHMASGCPEGALAQRGVRDGHADYSGLALVKITPQARTGPLRREHWMHLERAVHDAVKRPWHLHTDPELLHHHW